MSDRPESRVERAGNIFYFLFQTLPVIVAIVVLAVATIAYGLIKLVF